MIQIQQNQTLYVYLCICPVQNGKWPISNLNFAYKILALGQCWRMKKSGQLNEHTIADEERNVTC